MKKNNLIRFVQSLAFLPLMTMPLSLGSLHNEISQNLLVQKVNIEAKESSAINEAEKAKARALRAQAEAIDRYFLDRDMPLAGTGMKMAEEADKHGLDWRLLPAIAVRESTGGKNDCQRVKNNPFGWGSCKIGFDSVDKAIETLARNLSGNNPNTAHYYDNKSTRQILNAYNPPSIVAKYTDQVISIMNVIGQENINIAEIATIPNS